VDQSSQNLLSNVREIVGNIFIHSGNITGNDKSLKSPEITPSFGRFFAPTPSLGVWAPKCCTLTAHHKEKFREVMPTGPKVITANMQNYGPIFFYFHCQKLLGDPHTQWDVH